MSGYCRLKKFRNRVQSVLLVLLQLRYLLEEAISQLQYFLLIILVDNLKLCLDLRIDVLKFFVDLAW